MSLDPVDVGRDDLDDISVLVDKLQMPGAMQSHSLECISVHGMGSSVPLPTEEGDDTR